jgi:2-dehydro-3-deoxyphosphogluconate aldolase / (4S)-4-hydroxy-2-oxoglutarate aldolase
MPTLTSARLLELASVMPVMPVMVLQDADRAIPLAEALVAGGLPVIEVTLRTTVGLRAVTAIATTVPDAIIGAGTVNTPHS